MVLIEVLIDEPSEERRLLVQAERLFSSSRKPFIELLDEFAFLCDVAF